MEKSEAELARAGNELGQARAYQASLREKLVWVKEQRQQAQADLEHTQSRLHTVREQFANMETSKFWRLRTGWLAAKHYLRRAG